MCFRDLCLYVYAVIGRSVTDPCSTSYPQEWLEAELESLGIDSAAYARTVLSLLSRDTIDPAEVIQSGYVLVANTVCPTENITD